jgi:hypothetical protein
LQLPGYQTRLLLKLWKINKHKTRKSTYTTGVNKLKTLNSRVPTNQKLIKNPRFRLFLNKICLFKKTDALRFRNKNATTVKVRPKAKKRATEKSRIFDVELGVISVPKKITPAQVKSVTKITVNTNLGIDRYYHFALNLRYRFGGFLV